MVSFTLTSIPGVRLIANDINHVENFIAEGFWRIQTDSPFKLNFGDSDPIPSSLFRYVEVSKVW